MQVSCTASTIRRLIIAPAILFVMFSCPAAVRASVREIDLKDLVAKSDLIVVVTVTKTEADPDDNEPRDESFPPVKVATARVVETWKGKADKEIRFVASPTRYCDIADAKEGEKLVLFLERRGNSPMMIAHVGRGGMLLHDIKGKTYATLSDQVILPEGTRTISEPKKVSMTLPRSLIKAGEKGEITHTFTIEVRSIELGALRELVRPKNPERTK